MGNSSSTSPSATPSDAVLVAENLRHIEDMKARIAKTTVSRDAAKATATKLQKHMGTLHDENAKFEAHIQTKVSKIAAMSILITTSRSADGSLLHILQLRQRAEPQNSELEAQLSRLRVTSEQRLGLFADAFGRIRKETERVDLYKVQLEDGKALAQPLQEAIDEAQERHATFDKLVEVLLVRCARMEKVMKDNSPQEANGILVQMLQEEADRNQTVDEGN